MSKRTFANIAEIAGTEASEIAAFDLMKRLACLPLALEATEGQYGRGIRGCIVPEAFGDQIDAMIREARNVLRLPAARGEG